MLCDVVRGALSDFEVCEDTLEGARVPTHCLYPSFENVYVYVVKFGDNFRVHDGAGAYRNAWAHGRDSGTILRTISSEAERSKLMCMGESIVARDVGLDWLQSAILTVANVSSAAANRVVSRFVQASDQALVEKIDHVLEVAVGRARVAREYLVRGKSDGNAGFDFPVHDGLDPICSSIALRLAMRLSVRDSSLL